MSTEEAEKMVNDCALALGEHFDAVQILVSSMEGGSTRCVKRGVGNWYARQGMAHEFFNMDRAEEIALQIAEKLNEKPEGGEEWKEPV